MNKAVAEVRLHAQQRDRSGQGECIRRISASQSTGEEEAIGASLVGDANVAAGSSRTSEVDGFVERNRFTTIGTSSLILFAAIEDAVAEADDGFVVHLISDADTRPEVPFVPWNERLCYVTAIHFHCRKRC